MYDQVCQNLWFHFPFKETVYLLNLLNVWLFAVRHRKNQSEFACDLCQKVMKTEDSLKKHVRFTCLNERPVSCHICEKPFIDNKSVRIHVQSVHMKEKPHLCPSYVFITCFHESWIFYLRFLFREKKLVLYILLTSSKQPNFRIPNPQYLPRNFCFDFFNDSENTFWGFFEI